MSIRVRTSGEGAAAEPRPKRTTIVPPLGEAAPPGPMQVPILTVVWSVDENHRLGETTVVQAPYGDAEKTWFCLGRCDIHPTDIPLTFERNRPFATSETGPLESLGI